MKAIISTFALTVILSVICMAQFEKGSIELSLVGMAGAQKSTAEYKTYAFASTSIDLFVAEYISIEPQVDVLFNPLGPPAESIIGNISGSQRIANSNIAFFVKAGYGRGNSAIYPMTSEMTPRHVVDGWNVGIVDVGGGIKYLISNKAALKIEANFREETFPTIFYYFSPYGQVNTYEADVTDSNIALLIGFSIFL